MLDTTLFQLKTAQNFTVEKKITVLHTSTLALKNRYSTQKWCNQLLNVDWKPFCRHEIYFRAPLLWSYSSAGAAPVLSSAKRRQSAWELLGRVEMWLNGSLICWHLFVFSPLYSLWLLWFYVLLTLTLSYITLFHCKRKT